MKKISILLILCMIISLIPALSVSAADGEYYLKGIYQGATVVIQHEPTKTVTLVDAANKNLATTAATGVSKVVFTFNNGTPSEVYGTTFSYTMSFSYIGTQTLKYDVYKTGNSSDTPDESKTITFSAVAGTKNAASFTEDFESVSQANLAAAIVNNDGKNYDSGSLPLTTVDYKGSKALMLDATGHAALQLKGAPSATGSKVHYYEFDIATKYSYNHLFYLRNASNYADTSNEVVLFNSHKDTYLFSGMRLFPDVDTVRSIRVVLDYNGTPTATVYVGGVEWNRISLADILNSHSDLAIVPLIHKSGDPIYIDNFKYSVYDEMSFTGASIAGGDDNPVLKDLDEIRFTGDKYLEDQEWTDLVTISPAVDFTPYTDGADVVVDFNEELVAGTTYTVSISGVQDNYHGYYKDYTFTFRTLGEDENPKPEVTLLSPEAGKRFYPVEDTITLSAKATDELGGSVTHVEFYVNDVLIQTVYSADAVDDIYTCNPWTPDESYNYADEVEIIAKAYDDGKVLEVERDEVGVGESTPVKVTILCNEDPTITITSPEEGKVYYSNLPGVIVDIKPTINFEAKDVDGKIAAINIYVDGNPGIPVANPAEATSYALTENLAAGEHTISVEVYDDHGDRSTDDIKIIVDDTPCGKAGYILNEDYSAEDLLAKWSKSGNATFANGALSNYADIKGVIISGAAGSAERPIETNFTETLFAVDIKAAFNNISSKRTFKLGTAELATFAADGTITHNGTPILNDNQKPIEYQAGKVYTISAVVDAAGDKVYTFVNGTQIGSVSATYTFAPTVTVSHEGVGETAIISANASKLGDAVVPTVNTSGNSFTVNFPAGVDESTLEGNVSLMNLTTGKAVVLKYAGGVFTVDQKLSVSDTYEIVVLPDARDLNGNGYCGTYRTPFAATSTAEVANVTVEGGALNADTYTYTATLDVTFSNITEEKIVYLVYAAYNGAEMVDHNVVQVTAPATASDIPLSLSGVDAGTVIEAFVVDSMDDLNSVSDKIIVIK